MYANPGGTTASASADRSFAALQTGQTFSFQWAINWDSDVGNKGFNVYAGTNQLVNVNQAAFPGNITFNGTNTGLGFGTQAMTWSFAMTSSDNLLITSTGRDGSTNIAFSTNIAVASAPDSFRWYVSAMSPGDQRQQYYNNLNIQGTTTVGGLVAPTTIYVRIAASAPVSAALNGNITLGSSGADNKTVALSGSVVGVPVLAADPTTLPPVQVFTNTPSPTNSFLLTGNYLTSNVTVTAPSPFRISTNSSTGYTNSLLLAPAGGLLSNTVFVQVDTSVPIFASNNISAAGGGAAVVNVAAEATVLDGSGPQILPPTPALLTNFFTIVGANSASQSYTYSASSLSNVAITNVAPSGYEISADDAVFGPAVTNIPAANGVVTFTNYVRIAATTPATNSLTGSVAIDAAGVTGRTLDLQGAVDPLPVVGANPSSLSNLVTVTGFASSPRTVALTVSNLVATNRTVAISVPGSEFQISTSSVSGFASSLVLTNATSSLTNVPLFVRMTGAAQGEHAAEILVAVPQGAPLTNLLVPVAGTALPRPVVSVNTNFLGGMAGETGAPSAATNFTVSGTNLLQGIKVAFTGASSPFELSVDGTAFADEVVLEPLLLAADDAANYTTNTWTNGANAGTGFGPWFIATPAGATATLTNPAASGVTGMAASAFALGGTNGAYAEAGRAFAQPLAVGQRFSVEWGNNFDTGGAGNKGVNIYAGGFDPANQLININMAGSAEITINGQSMFTNYGTAPITLNFQYVATNALRVYAAGRDGTEIYDNTFPVTGAPDAVKFYAGDLAADDSTNRLAFFDNMVIASAATNGGGVITNQPVYVRLKSGAPLGTNTATVRVSSAPFAEPREVALEGFVFPDLPAGLVVSPALVELEATEGSASAPVSLSVQGSGLSAPVEVQLADGTNFELSTDSGTTWSTNSASLPVLGGFVDRILLVRSPSSSAAGLHVGALDASSGAEQTLVALRASVYKSGGDPAAVAAPTALTGFSAIEGSNSPTKMFLASARNLGATDLVATASAGYEISTNSTNFFAASAAVTPAAGVVTPVPFYVRIATNAPVTNSLIGTVDLSSGASTGLVVVTLDGSVTGIPTILPVASLQNFTAITGFFSAPQSFTVGGRYLTADIEVTGAGLPLQFSTNGVDFSPSVTVPRTEGITPQQTVSVRLATGQGAGSYSGSISLASTGAAPQSIPVSAVVSANTGPVLAVDPVALPVFGTDLGQPSDVESFLVTGSALTLPITVTAPAGFQVSTDGVTFGPTATLPPPPTGALNNDVVVRLAGSSLGLFAGNVSVSGASAAPRTVAVKGTVFNVDAQIFATPLSLSNFTTLVGTPSAAQTFTAAARKLPADLVALASTGYQVSTNGTNYSQSVSVPAPGGVIDGVTVHVRIGADATATNALSGSVTLSSDGEVTPATVTLSGKVDPLRAPAVRLVAPSNNPTVIGAGSTLRLIATVTDTNQAGAPGTIKTFQFLTNGVPIPGAATSNVTSPFTFQYDWKPANSALPALVSARAVDTEDLTSTSAAVQVRLPKPGEQVPGFSPVARPGGVVRALAGDVSGRVYVGGDFTFFTSPGSPAAVTPAPRIARLTASGAIDPTFNLGTGPTAGPNARVRAVAVLTNGVLFGGDFTAVSGAKRVALAWVNPAGLLASRFDARIGGLSPFVQALAAYPPDTNGTTKVLVGGSFTSILGQPRSNLARIIINNADRSVTLDTTFTNAVSGVVNSIALQSGGKILLGGSFGAVNGRTMRGIARLNADGSIDNTFVVATGANNGFNSTVNSVAATPAGNVYAGGFFTAYRGAPGYNYLARLNGNGSLAGFFNAAPGIDAPVAAVLPVGTDEVIAVGRFTSFANRAISVPPTPAGRIVRLRSNGREAAKPEFDAGTGFNGEVLQAATMPNGNLVVAGAFTAYNGRPAPGIAMLSLAPAPLVGPASRAAAPTAIATTPQLAGVPLAALAGGSAAAVRVQADYASTFVPSAPQVLHLHLDAAKNPSLSASYRYSGEFSTDQVNWSTNGVVRVFEDPSRVIFRSPYRLGNPPGQYLRLKVLAP